jgi:phage terminase large subunit GpA-like protein
MMSERQKIHDVFSSVFKPRPRQTVWQWAEQNVVLSRRVTPFPGPYRTDWCSYVRGPQEWFTDPAVQDIVLCWASRSSKSETMLNCIRWSIAVDPQPTGIIVPTEHLARSLSETRIQPSILDSPALRAQMPEDMDKFKLLEMHFRHMTLFLVGSNSPANLSGRGWTVVMFDEIDKYPAASRKETGAFELGLERTKERWNRKHLIASTPTIESGQIWTEFKLGDQRYYHVPCPNCKKLQVLTFRQLRWSEDAKEADGKWNVAKVRATTRYHCVHCDFPIEDRHKSFMLDPRNGATWIATAKGNEPRRISCHLSSLYPSWIPFGDVSVKFLESKVNAEKLQSFVNSWLAEPFYSWGDQAEQVEAVKKLATAARHVSVPEDHKALMYVDVQQDSVWFVVRAFDKDGNSVLLDYGNLPGFEEAEQVAQKWNCVMRFTDSNYRPAFVFRWCMNNRLWIPTLGNDALSVPLRWSTVEVDGGMLKGRQQLRRLVFRPMAWKDELERRIKGRGGAKWELPENPGEDYIKQLTAEVRVERKLARGRVVVEYQQIRRHNHLRDCETGLLAGFDAIKSFIWEYEPAQDNLPPTPRPPEIDRDGWSEHDIWRGENMDAVRFDS